MAQLAQVERLLAHLPMTQAIDPSVLPRFEGRLTVCLGKLLQTADQNSMNSSNHLQQALERSRSLSEAFNRRGFITLSQRLDAMVLDISSPLLTSSCFSSFTPIAPLPNSAACLPKGPLLRVRLLCADVWPRQLLVGKGHTDAEPNWPKVPPLPHR